MPPFPRASKNEPTQPIEADPTSPDSSASTAPSDSPPPEAAESAKPDPLLPTEPQSLDPSGSELEEDPGSSRSDGDADELFPDDEDDLLEEGPALGANYGDEDADFEDDEEDPEESRSFRSTVTAELARRAERSLLNGMEHVADTFDETAHRIGRIAQLRGGPAALTLGPVHSTVGWLEGAADYLRTSDLEAVQSDLRGRVRARPVQSLGIALCTGWLLGRILR